VATGGRIMTEVAVTTSPVLTEVVVTTSPVLTEVASATSDHSLGGKIISSQF
jgi:hypothetical protein